MKRSELEHILRAAATIAEERDVLVIGSQAILGTLAEDELPAVTTLSMEADVAFFDDADNHRSDLVDGAIGELSPFHEMYGYYAQGVSVSTATLPRGWRDRLVVIETASTAPGRGNCLEAHDCVISKLVAGREKASPSLSHSSTPASSIARRCSNDSRSSTTLTTSSLLAFSLGSPPSPSLPWRRPSSPSCTRGPWPVNPRR